MTAQRHHDGEGGAAGLDERVTAVRQARERLGHDLDRMTDELRATVGVTMEKTLWKALTTGTAVLAGVIARKALVSAWRKTRHSEPPDSPFAPRGMGEMVSWAAATGVAMGVARALAARGTAVGWEKAMGGPPPLPATAQTR